MRHWLSDKHPADDEITLYLADELPAARRAAISQHLETCRRCAAFYEDQQAAQRTLARLDPEASIPQALNAHLRAQLTQAAAPALAEAAVSGSEDHEPSGTKAASATPADAASAPPAPTPFPARRRGALSLALVAAVVGSIALVAGLLVSSGLLPLTAGKGTPGPASATPAALITIHIEVDRLVEAAPSCGDLLVADATVGQLLPGRWSTPDGLSPSGAIDMKSSWIYTPVQFSAMHVLLDHRTVPTQTFSFLGGTADYRKGTEPVLRVKLVVDGYPTLQQGYRYLLVFEPTTNPYTSPPELQNQKRLLVAEAWPITAQNQVILWPGSAEPGGSPTPERTEPLAQIEQQLASCRA